MASIDDSNSPTATSAPVMKTPGRKHVVRVSFPTPTNGTTPQALIETRDGSIRMRVPVEMVRKRMGARETTAYFVAWLRDHGTLEIGDRAVMKETGW